MSSTPPELPDPAERELSPRALVALFRDFPEAVIHGDPERIIVGYNLAAERLFGVDGQELLGKSSRILYADPPDWQRRGEESFNPNQQTELRPYDVLYRRKDGAPFWGSTYGRVVRAPDGTVLGYYGVVRDISAARRQQERAHFLEKLGAMVESLDPDQLLNDVAQLAVPLLADWCAIDLLEEGGTIRRVAVAHDDPAARALALGWWERFPPVDGDSFVHRLAQRRTSKGVVELNEALLSRWPDAELAALLRELSVKQSLVVPVASGSRFFGALTLVSTHKQRRLHPEDQQVCELLGQRIGLSLENARLYQTERYARLRVSRLHQLTSALSTVSTLEDVAEAVCRVGSEASEAQAAALWSLSSDGSLQMRGSFGVPEHLLAPFREIPPDSLLPALQAVRDNQAVYVESPRDMLQRVQQLANMLAETIGSYASIPVRGMGGVIGLITYGFEGFRRFSELDRAYFANLASHCGPSIERALLHDQLQGRARRDQFLARLSQELGQAQLGLQSVLDGAVRLCAETFDAAAVVRLLSADQRLIEYAAVWHSDPTQRERLRVLLPDAPLSADAPLLQAVLERRQVTWIERTAEQTQLPDSLRDYARDQSQGGALLAPLVSRGQVIGTLSVAHLDARRFSGEQTSLVGEAAARIAVAVDNARLFEAASESARTATEASRIKDEFLATVSHELRTPLNAMLGWSSILLQELDKPETVRRGAETIRRNAQAQGRIIEDILDVSRIITGKLNIEPKPVDLEGVVEQALEVVRPSALAKSQQLLVTPPAQPVLLVADAPRLQQVLWNLLSNAIKFTEPEGVIRVALEHEHNSVQIVVSDTGRGIAAEVLPLVFDRFHQADSSTTRRFGGLGLGLAIVRHIVELHGGSVRAESAGLGHGSTFTVTLPVRVAAPVRSDELTAAQAALSERPPAMHDLSEVRVLIVDDDADVRELLYVLLTRAGATVESASAAGEALHAVSRFLPHVLVSDIGMPGEDGYQLLKKVRALPAEEGGEVPAIALSAYSRAEDRSQALLVGFATHLAKPVQSHDLLATIANLASLRAR